MAESVARETHRLSHEKVSFLDVGVQGLCPRLQAYFLALSRIQITRRCWTACLRSTKAIRRRPLPISLSELGYGHLKFSFRRVSPTFDKVSG